MSTTSFDRKCIISIFIDLKIVRRYFTVINFFLVSQSFYKFSLRDPFVSLISVNHFLSVIQIRSGLPHPFFRGYGPRFDLFLPLLRILKVRK